MVEIITTFAELDEDNQPIGMDWEAEKSYFMDYLQKEIESYERRYNTSVRYICLAGRVGRWNGTFVGGRQLNYDNNPLECMGNVDDITVSIDDNRFIDIRGHHHDGTHVMNIYLISDGLYEKWDAKGYMDTPEFYEWLVDNRKPLRLKKKNDYYNV